MNLDLLEVEANKVQTEQPTEVVILESPVESAVVENVVAEPILEKAQEKVIENSVVANAQPQTQEIVEPVKEKPSNRFASDKVAELNAYLAKNPEKEISDWQKLKTPTDELDSKELLKQYYTDKEGMTEKEIAYELKQLEFEGDDIDAEFEDEDDKLKREATTDRELRKAREWRNAHIAEQLSNLDSENVEVQQPTDSVRIEDLQKEWQANAEKSRKSYLENMYSVLPEFNSIELNVNGDKVQFVPDEDFKSKFKTVVEDPEKLYQKFQNEDGSLKDAKGWADLLLWGNEETREQLIEFRIEQAILRDKKAQNNNRRNINADTNIGIPASNSEEDGFAEWYSDHRKTKF